MENHEKYPAVSSPPQQRTVPWENVSSAPRLRNTKLTEQSVRKLVSNNYSSNFIYDLRLTSDTN